MDILFDPAKNARNIDVHGIAFEQASGFHWDTAFNVEDSRRDYGEKRFQAFGLIETRVHVLIYTRRGDGLHIISLRKANKREVRRYENQRKEEEIRTGRGES